MTDKNNGIGKKHSGFGEAFSQIKNDSRELQVVQEAWLLYFNEYLFGNGLITEDKRNKMISKIAERKKGNGNASCRIDFR